MRPTGRRVPGGAGGPAGAEGRLGRSEGRAACGKQAAAAPWAAGARHGSARGARDSRWPPSRLVSAAARFAAARSPVLRRRPASDHCWRRHRSRGVRRAIAPQLPACRGRGEHQQQQRRRRHGAHPGAPGRRARSAPALDGVCQGALRGISGPGARRQRGRGRACARQGDYALRSVAPPAVRPPPATSRCLNLMLKMLYHPSPRPAGSTAQSGRILMPGSEADLCTPSPRDSRQYIRCPKRDLRC